MPLARLTILLAPQAAVAMAYLRFQAAVIESLDSAAGTAQFDLLADVTVVLVIGVLTLAANGLIAVVLLKLSAKLGGQRSSQGSETVMPRSWPPAAGRGTTPGADNPAVPRYAGPSSRVDSWAPDSTR